MKIEFIILIILIPILLNIYYDGKFFNLLDKFKFIQYEKYYKMAGIIFIFFCIYIYIKKNPNNKNELLKSASGYVKYLPVDKKTTSFIQPFLNMATSSNFNNNNSNNYFNNNNNNNLTHQQQKILISGGKSNKRSVSETKKKYVAAEQGWKCGDCKRQLPAWFEIDHNIRLDQGGSNHVDNLVALCRDCHGKKTAVENL